ncbi:uncharacterized protein ACIB01_010668 [Guaruba guarouba]
MFSCSCTQLITGQFLPRGKKASPSPLTSGSSTAPQAAGELPAGLTSVLPSPVLGAAAPRKRAAAGRVLPVTTAARTGPAASAAPRRFRCPRKRSGPRAVQPSPADCGGEEGRGAAARGRSCLSRTEDYNSRRAPRHNDKPILAAGAAHCLLGHVVSGSIPRAEAARGAWPVSAAPTPLLPPPRRASPPAATPGPGLAPPVRFAASERSGIGLPPGRDPAGGWRRAVRPPWGGGEGESLRSRHRRAPILASFGDPMGNPLRNAAASGSVWGRTAGPGEGGWGRGSFVYCFLLSRKVGSAGHGLGAAAALLALAGSSALSCHRAGPDCSSCLTSLMEEDYNPEVNSPL